MRISKKFIVSTSLLEISLLILSIIAFSYIIYDSTSIVSAQEGLGLGCCEKTKPNQDGSVFFCQDFVNEDNCDEGFQYNTCASTTNCRLGCCITQSGTCSPNAPRKLCEEAGGAWQDSPSCNLQACRRGCCVIGSQTVFMTETECQDIYSGDFRAEVNTEPECIALSYFLEEGACVYEQGGLNNCRFLTQQSCNQIIDSTFNLGVFCSDESLDTVCESQDHKECVPGKDEVYWFDSCGNREGIVEDMACDRFHGSTCAYDNSGEAYCRDMDCHNIPTNINGGKNERINGESWCVYETRGSVSDGKEIPGTSHYRYVCLDGDIIKENCRTARSEICTESDIETQDGRTFARANCEANLAFNCIQLNIQKSQGDITNAEFNQQCEDNPHCRLYSLSGRLNPSLTMCLPNHPVGFINRDSSTAQTTCSYGTYRCTYVESYDGDWHNEGGQDCGSDSLKKQINELCMSMGDCGVHVNIEKKITGEGLRSSYLRHTKIDRAWPGEDEDKWNGPTVVGIPFNSWVGDYQSYAEGAGTDKIRPGNMNNLITALTGASGVFTQPGTEEYERDIAWMEENLEGMLGLGGLFAGLGTLSWAYIGPNVALSVGWDAFLAGGGGAGTSWGAVSGFFYILMSTIIGAAIGYGIASIFGDALPPEWVEGLTIAGAVAGLTYGIAQVAGASWAGPFAWVALAVIVVVAWVVAAIGSGYRTTEYTYECLPWQPPRGGDDCNLCNTKYQGTCDSYKCQSLGTACLYDNVEKRCIEYENDGKPPLILPLDTKNILQEQGYVIIEDTPQGLEFRNSDGNCISQFDMITFGVITDEDTKCKYDFEHKDYSDMVGQIGTNWSREHITTRSLFSIAPGNASFYIRCVDRFGEETVSDYILRTCIEEEDIQSPGLVLSRPVDGSFTAYGKDTANLTVYVTEPARCRWDTTDKGFELMNNNFTEVGSIGASFLLYILETNVPLNEYENVFYVRCEDNSENLNTNTESSVITLYKTETPLEIKMVSPLTGEEKVFGNKADLRMVLETSGGIDGVATCKYSFTGFETMLELQDTRNVMHQHYFDLGIPEGPHTMYIKCEDYAENIANKTIPFSIKLDRTIPEVIRVYHKSGNLYLETNEPSVCRYSYDNCMFNFENGTTMSGILTNDHNAAWKEGSVFYIKCQDEWGNKPDRCSVEVKAVT